MLYVWVHTKGVAKQFKYSTECFGTLPELKLTASHWLFSVHICQMANHFPKWLAAKAMPLSPDCFADILASLHELCGFWSYLNDGI